VTEGGAAREVVGARWNAGAEAAWNDHQPCAGQCGRQIVDHADQVDTVPVQRLDRARLVQPDHGQSQVRLVQRTPQMGQDLARKPAHGIGIGQVVRADRESTSSIDARKLTSLRRALSAIDSSLDGVVISDYGKGLISPQLLATVREFKHNPVITADPKPQNIAAFEGVYCIAPNAAEAESASGITVKTEADLARAARILMERTGAKHVLITRGEHGMTLYSKKGRPLSVPAVARQVYDVSGAGDTVMSTLTLALAAGAPIERAVMLANVAAGVVVEKLGTATATADEILKFAIVEGVARPQAAVASRKKSRARRR